MRPTKRKPKIDIDNEIEEANRLAELFRKMQNASKVAARKATRSKQRLMKKADQLSEQDLMRLAVLKRCGIFAPHQKMTIRLLFRCRWKPPRRRSTVEGAGAHLGPVQDFGLFSPWCRGCTRRTRQVHRSSCGFIIGGIEIL